MATKKAPGAIEELWKLGDAQILLKVLQVVGNSQVGSLSLPRYEQMSSVLSTPLFAHSWTWDEPKPFKCEIDKTSRGGG